MELGDRQRQAAQGLGRATVLHALQTYDRSAVGPRATNYRNGAPGDDHARPDPQQPWAGTGDVETPVQTMRATDSTGLQV